MNEFFFFFSLILCVVAADKDVLVFDGNRTHNDHFKLMLADGSGSMLIGGRYVRCPHGSTIITQILLPDFKNEPCFFFLFDRMFVAR